MNVDICKFNPKSFFLVLKKAMPQENEDVLSSFFKHFSLKGKFKSNVKETFFKSVKKI